MMKNLDLFMNQVCLDYKEINIVIYKLREFKDQSTLFYIIMHCMKMWITIMEKKY